jgi:hypothetical protein
LQLFDFIFREVWLICAFESILKPQGCLLRFVTACYQLCLCPDKTLKGSIDHD